MKTEKKYKILSYLAMVLFLAHFLIPVSVNPTIPSLILTTSLLIFVFVINYEYKSGKFDKVKNIKKKAMIVTILLALLILAITLYALIAVRSFLL